MAARQLRPLAADFGAVVRRCARDESPGHAVARLLVPQPDDYFVLKPKHSGFYASSLGILLDYLGVTRLILTGLTTAQCVRLTAGDAYMRDFNSSCLATVSRRPTHAITGRRSPS
jgi:nicotinamidase-related amidase